MKFNLKLISLILILFFISVSAACADDSAQTDDNNDTLLSTDNIDEIGTDDLANKLEASNAEPKPGNELQTIINKAQAGDTIELDSDYYRAKYVIQIDKEITIDGKGHTIDGKNQSIMQIKKDISNVVIKNIIFVNGVNANGGAIYVQTGVKSLTIDNCTFKNCKATTYSGGAIHIKENNNNCKITNNRFESNTAQSSGGAIKIDSGNYGTISNNIFTSNKVISGANCGGALMIEGSHFTITNNRFESNTAPETGGAIRIEGDSQIVSNNTFKGNLAPGSLGGAICALGHNSQFTYNTFIGNRAGRDGGALFVEGTKVEDMCHGVTISNNVFINNKVTGSSEGSHGGAISMAGENCKISYNNFTSNHADTIGGAIRWNGANSAMGDIIGNRFESNDAVSGGAIYISGKGIKISKNTFNNNKVTTGAGGTINIKGNNAVISDNEISNSNTKAHGGGIYVEGTNTKLTNNVLTKCSAGDNGGGVYLTGSGSVTGCSFISCSAASYGGGVFFKNNDFTLGGNTFTGDSASKGGSNYYPTSIPSGDMPTTLTAKYDKTTKNIVATVKDATGKAISGLKVGFAIDGVKYNVTDANGQAKYSTSGLAEKKYSVVVKAMNNPGYDDSNKVTVEVDLTKTSTTLTAPNVVTKYNGGKKLVATLKDANGKAIKGAKVKVVLGNSTQTLTTDANGQVSVSTDGLALNTYKATITFDGTDVYKKSSTTATVTVTNQEPAKIFLRNALYFVLQTKMVKVTLWDANNKPLVGKTVHITLNEWNLTYHGVTDENGDALIRVGVGFGVHSATVTFDGDENYTGTSKTGSIRVIKETPSLMLPGAYSKFKATNPVKIVKIYLKDRYDKPLLPGTKVFLKVNGQTYVGLTDLDGIATISINIKNTGSYNAELIYLGNTAYNAVKRSTKITIV